MSHDRRWLEIGVRLAGAEETDALLPELLFELGGRAVVEADGWLVTHLDEPDNPDELVTAFREGIRDGTGADPELRVRWQAHEDWAETWKRGLAPRRITDRLVVRPSWTDFEPRDRDVVVVLDPGMAFGTAEHGTTRGCLRVLDSAVRGGETLLDVGAGSGILSVAALLLGAKSATAIDGDPYACEAMLENAESNGVAGRLTVVERWADDTLLGTLGEFDIVVANIETGLLRPLVPGLARAVAPGGRLVLSGILEHEWPEMRAMAEAAGFRLEILDQDGEWCAGRFVL